MKSTAQWLTLFSVVGILSLKVTPAQNIQSLSDPRISVQTAQRGIPSAILEWESHQLFVSTEGTYNFIGKSPVPFTGLTIGWRASESNANPADFQIEIHTRPAMGTWSVLRTNGETAPGETPSGLFWSHLYVTADGGVHTDYEIRVQAPSNVSLNFVRISVADASAGLKVNRFWGEQVLQKGAHLTTSPPQPSIIPRSDWWGSLPPSELNSPRWSPVAITISHAIVHHTVDYNNPPNPAQIVRQIWDNHANVQQWGDIGYNFLIDHFGNIYQGRYNPWLSTMDVRAAHAGGGGGGANAVSVGVALIGQFHPPLTNPPAGMPDSRALRNAENLIAWRFDQRNLDPLGTANIITYWGTRNLDRITGHRNIGVLSGATDCPGDNLYNLLPTIRTNVRNLLTPTVSITFTTLPAGLQILVDGVVYTTPKTFDWQPSSIHVVTAISPQNGSIGTRYVFSSWNNGQPQTHTITIPNMNTIYTANYTTQYYLTMNAGSGGTVSPPSGWRNSGEFVPIQATPNPGYSFNNWTGTGSGSYTGTNASANVTTNGPITETANFSPIEPRTLTVASSNPNSSVNITVTPTDNNSQGNGTTQFTRTYNHNTSVTLTAPATAGGNNFQKWLRNGMDVGTDQTTTVKMDGDYTMTAVYTTPPTTHTLIVASSNPNNGVNITVTPTDNNSQGNGTTQFTRTYNHNTSVTLTAPATVGSNNFQKWLRNGMDAGTGQTTTVKMDADYTMTAIFGVSPGCYRLTTGVCPNGLGEISVSPQPNCTGGYNHGTQLRLEANANPGYTFLGWSGSGGTFSDLSSPTTDFTITGNATVTASFTTSQTNFWQQTNGTTGANIQSIVINSSGYIFVGTDGGGVYRSTDNGGIWTQVINGMTRTSVKSLAINSSGYLFAGTIDGGVYRSTDNGGTWTQVTNGLTYPDVYALAINSSGHIFAGTFIGLVFRSMNNGDTWTQVTQPSGYPIKSFAINSSGHIFIGTFLGNGGVFRSTDNGDNWTQVINGLANPNVQALAINSSGHIFAGTEGGIFRSLNNGDNWTSINIGLTNNNILSLAVNSAGYIFAGTNGGGVFRSTDNGETWTEVNSGLTNTSISALAINSNDYIFAGASNGMVFRSVLPTTSCYCLATRVSPNGSGTVIASTSPNCSGGYDYGTSINLTATPGMGYTFSGWTGTGGTFADPTVSTTTFTITGTAVVTANFKSSTWVKRYNGSGNSDDEAKAIAVDGAGNIYVAGSSIGSNENFDYVTIKYNSSGKPQWTKRYNGPGNGDDLAQALAIDAAGNVYVTGTSVGSNGNQDYATIKYNSAGTQQWARRFNGTGNHNDEAKAIAVDGVGNVYVTGSSIGSSGLQDYVTVKYNNAGVQQWSRRYNGPGNADDKANALVVDGTGNVYVTGSSIGSSGFADYATIKYNGAGAKQWEARYNGPGNNDDEGQSLAIDGTGNVYVTGFSFGIGSSGLAYATIKYNNAGVQQWVARYNGTGNADDKANAMAIDGSGNIYVTGMSYGANGSYDYTTVKYNSAGSRQWVARYNAAGNNTDEAKALAVDGSGNVYVTGYSYGSNGFKDYATIKYLVSGASITFADPSSSEDMDFSESDGDEQVEIDRTTTLPTTFYLAQNFPNPFNPTTTIRFAIPSAGKVKLTVYNVRGELVRTLVDGEVSAGYHEVTFDASKLASGVYFYRLEAGSYVATQKMILAK